MIEYSSLEISAPLPTLLIIPSGIGCSVGGFAGDAIPAARLLAAASGCLITHPNVLNGASLYWCDRRVQYVEGYSLDRFAAGDILLRPVRKQKVGLLIDSGIEEELIQKHLAVANACRATLGLDIGPVIKTVRSLELSINSGSSGASWGYIKNPDDLLKAAERLKEEDVTAIAVVTRFPDDLNKDVLDAYRKGKGVDALAGAEAIISHLIVKHFSIPCAHAPALMPLPIDPLIDPRAAAEELGHTFLPCVLVGLSRSPDLVTSIPYKTSSGQLSRNLLSCDQLGAVVVPNGALGGEAVLSCLEKNIPLIAVTNPATIDVNAEALRLYDHIDQKKQAEFFQVDNYVEAAGLILALREGLYRDSLYRPSRRISHLSIEN